MTYCIGAMLDKGMIFASDSRTNAGVDNFAKFCKMTVFERRGNRVIVLLSSGNLAGTQAVISVLTQRCADGDAATNVLGARTMFDVVRLVSDAVRDIENRDAGYLEENNVRFDASFIVGGQIVGEPLAEPDRRVLRSPICMVDNIFQIEYTLLLAGPDGLLDRVEDHRGSHRGSDAPAQDPASVGVGDKGDVGKP